MYCENCKKEFAKDNKFCDICGEKLTEKKINNEQQKNIKKSKKNKNKTGLIITLVVLGIILIVGSTIFFGISLFKYIDKMEKLEYIKLDSDEIPTMYISNNDIKIDSYYKDSKKDEVEINLEYYDNLYEYNMIDTYIKLLEENGFTYVDIDDDNWYLVKESVDIGKIIIINIYENYDYDNELYFTVTYEKKKDDIYKYIKKVTYKRVGEEKYGFIDIDSTWQPYLGTSDMIQYEGEDGFLTLYYIENYNMSAREYMSQMYNYLASDNSEDLEITEVTVDGYDAYQLYGYYYIEDTYIAIWCFLDSNNTLHYIEIDANKYNSEAFSKIESYSILN